MSKLPVRILVLCTGNSCRSQMAEGLFQWLASDEVVAFSAGVEPQGYVHPFTIRVMQEIDIDISQARSKSVDEFLNQSFDFVVTVCDHAAEHCPTFANSTTRIHWPIDDPFTVVGDEATRLEAYRRARDKLRERIESFLTELL
ncbi:MAG: arsenate reductase ArsC [Anaerolineales bacterium]